MTPQVLLRSPPLTNGKMQPLLTDKSAAETTSMELKTTRREIQVTTTKRCGEVVGVAAAVCCCCPCTLMNLLVLAVYKVPAGFCRKAAKKRRSLMKKKQKQQALSAASNSSGSGGSREELEREVREIVERGKRGAGDGETEAVDLEEMWDQFHGGGFWRSRSQRAT